MTEIATAKHSFSTESQGHQLDKGDIIVPITVSGLVGKEISRNDAILSTIGIIHTVETILCRMVTSI